MSTDPDIWNAIIYGLEEWINPRENSHAISPPISEETLGCMILQEEITWGSFIEGFIHNGWAQCQQDYYTKTGSRRSGNKWEREVRHLVWNMAWELWQHRNKVKHNQETETWSQEMTVTDRAVRRLYRRYEGTIPDEDMYLYRNTLEDLLTNHNLTNRSGWDM
jgi:hypothetical protein